MDRQKEQLKRTPLSSPQLHRHDEPNLHGDRSSAPVGVTPVGVTIAQRRQQQQQQHNDRDVTEDGQTSGDDSQSQKSFKRPVSSFRLFLEGTSLYMACLIVPSLIGFFYQYFLQLKRDGGSHRFKTLGGSNDTMGTTLDPWSLSYYTHQASYYLCPDAASVDPNSYTAYLCPSASLAAVLSPDTGHWWSDSALVAGFSFALALLRILIVQMLVPVQSAKQLQAMVRVKSIHLLSTNYNMTPRNSMSHVVSDEATASTNNKEKSQSPPKSFFGSQNLDVSSYHDYEDDDNIQLGLGIEESEHGFDESAFRGHRNTQDDMGATAAAAAAAAAAMGGGRLADPSLAQQQSLYAAPRYATAVFRLIFSATASVLAYTWFHTANFWPWYVGGTAANASTKHCWDLSGGMTLAYDGDFDLKNAALKRYFLWQASYHWHSGAFHILSLAMLLLHPKHAAPRRFLSVQQSTSDYIRSLFQHTLALVLIAVAYVFSSLRRLAAIGMFAFDVSNCFLHLLQLCINRPGRPDDSGDTKGAISNRQLVSIVYYWLVLPSFVLTRFGIWPALWYSATFESQNWLRQLENTLFPKSAFILQSILQLWMVLLTVVTVVYLKRLVHHPHLQNILLGAHE